MLAKVFKSGNSMAIRIPKGVDLANIRAFEVQKLGENILLKPANNGDSWSGFFEAVAQFRGKIEIPNDDKPQGRDFGKIFT